MSKPSVLKKFYVNQNRGCFSMPKWSLNPYGHACAFRCVYCYADPEEEILPQLDPGQLEIELPNAEFLPVRLGTYSDPYPPVEAELCITRRCLEIISRLGRPIEVVTKSELVARDAELLGKAVVEISINTLDTSISTKFEPGAPPPERRLAAIRALTGKGVHVVARIDPIIPLHCNEENVSALLEALAHAGVGHVIAKFLQLTSGNFDRIKAIDPALADLYQQHGVLQGRYRYLPREMREGLMTFLRKKCDDAGVKMSVCREPDLCFLSSAPCDVHLKALMREHGESSESPKT
nr:hypothetical protein [Candidatus Sigynarchaeota archaeon]